MKTSLPLFQNLIALPFSCVIWLFILPNQQYLPDDITPLQKTLIQHLTADSLKRYQILLSVQPNFISWGSEEPSVVRQHWGRKESPFNSDDPVISTSLEGLLKQLNEVLKHHAPMSNMKLDLKNCLHITITSHLLLTSQPYSVCTLIT